MEYYYNVKGIGKTREECKQSYEQALTNANLPEDIRVRALYRFDLINIDDGLWEMRPNSPRFIYDV